MTVANSASSGGSSARILPTNHEDDPDLVMRAMVAACAYIARADGVTSPVERHRTEKLIDALHAYAGFSAEQAKLEYNSHMTAFELNPAAARRGALDVIARLRDRPNEIKMVLAACQHVLEADGVYHPYEYEALQDIGRAIARS